MYLSLSMRAFVVQVDFSRQMAFMASEKFICQIELMHTLPFLYRQHLFLFLSMSQPPCTTFLHDVHIDFSRYLPLSCACLFLDACNAIHPDLQFNTKHG